MSLLLSEFRPLNVNRLRHPTKEREIQYCSLSNVAAVQIFVVTTINFIYINTNNAKGFRILARFGSCEYVAMFEYVVR